VATITSLGPGDFDDLDAFQLQPARQADAVGAGAFHAGAADLARALRPPNQRRQSASRGRKRLASGLAAKAIDHDGGVRLEVRVDSEDQLAAQARDLRQLGSFPARRTRSARPPAGAPDRTLRVLAQGSYQVTNAAASDALSTPPDQADSSTQVHPRPNGQEADRSTSQAQSGDAENRISN
jgi:hypothetical protein